MCCMVSVASALTPVETTAVQHAVKYIQDAQRQAVEQKQILDQTTEANAQLERIAVDQQNQINKLGDEIDKAHKNEEALAAYNAKAKPIIDQVNKYWGLGAFAYGLKVLARHLLILVAVLAVIALVVFGLSFAFPALGAFIRTAGTVIAAFLRKIGNLFKKK